MAAVKRAVHWLEFENDVSAPERIPIMKVHIWVFRVRVLLSVGSKFKHNGSPKKT